MLTIRLSSTLGTSINEAWNAIDRNALIRPDHSVIQSLGGLLRSNRSFILSSVTNPIVTQSTPPQWIDRRRLSYDLGARIAFGMDLDIVRQDSKASVDDWLKVLLNEASAGHARTITSRRLREALQRIAPNAEKLWRIHVLEHRGFPHEDEFVRVIEASKRNVRISP